MSSTYITHCKIFGIQLEHTVDCKIFIDDLFRWKLNTWNILRNIRGPIPILVAKVWWRNLDYVKLNILLAKKSRSTVICLFAHTVRCTQILESVIWHYFNYHASLHHNIMKPLTVNTSIKSRRYSYTLRPQSKYLIHDVHIASKILYTLRWQYLQIHIFMILAYSNVTCSRKRDC